MISQHPNNQVIYVEILTLRKYQCATGTKMKKALKDHMANSDPSVRLICIQPDCSL